MINVRESAIGLAATAALVLGAASAGAAERTIYLNVGPGAATPPSPSSSASGAAGAGLRNNSENNRGNGSSFCQQPIYDNWGNVTGYRQGGC